MRRAKSLFSLPSLAALLQAFFVPFTLHPQVAAKKKAQPGLVLASPVGLLGASFRFVSSCCLQQLTNRSGQGRGDCSFQSQTPLAAAPYRLACSTFVSADKMSERRQVLPLELLWCDGLCTPQGADGADKYIYQCWETWWNCSC